MQYNEDLNQQQARYNMEVGSLREQLQESDSTRDALEREVRIFFFLLVRGIVIALLVELEGKFF